MIKFSYPYMVGKGFKYYAIFLLGFLIANFIGNFPGIADTTVVDLLSNTALGQLTVGGLLTMLYNWLKVKWGFKLP